MEKKYELTNDTITIDNSTLHRIKALRSFCNVREGDLGGYIHSEENLSHEGNCWVYDNARVFGNAEVYGNTIVYGSAEVYGNAKVYGSTRLYGESEICGNAIIKSKKDYITFKNWWSSGRYFTWTRSNNKWKVGCFYGTGDELIKKAYSDSEISGKCYEQAVRYVEGFVIPMLDSGEIKDFTANNIQEQCK